jgi:glycosyltransferase involved in cell wall biosynthesis
MNYLKKRGTKIIWTFHDSWNYSAHTATLDYYNGMLPDCIQNRNELREYPRAYFSPFNNYYRKKKIFSDFNQLILVSPSNWLSKMVENSFFSAYPCITINNGIDLEVFYPEKNIVLIESNGLQDKKIYLFVASVWSEKKGVKYLNELADLVDSKKEKIVAIGKLDKGISLNHQILHINQTEDQSELRSWYSNADVFVNPTLSEVFGMTNVESQACGTPVVSFDTGGSPESIVEGTGLVVEKGDLSQLLRAIRDLENVSVEKCVRNARRFEAERCFEKYLSLYEER